MTAAASATASHGAPYHYIAHRKCVTLRQPPATSGDACDAAPRPSSSNRSRLGSCSASADKYRVADVENGAAPAAAAPDAAAAAGAAAAAAAHNRSFGTPERLIRGRCRQMLREEWVSLAEVWYRASPPDAQRLFRRLLRGMHGEEAPAVLGSLSRDSVAALLRTDQSRDCYTQAASSYALGGQVPEAQARVLRRARVLLKVYLSPVLRPAYHAGAFYWCVKHSGTPGVEDDVRTVFSGIASFSGYKFSAYTRQFARTSDGGSLVAGRVVPLHQTLRAASAAAAAAAAAAARLPGLRKQPLADGEGGLARSFEQLAAAAKEAQQHQQVGGGGGGAARAGSARTVRHWAAQGLLRPARRVPPWLMDSKGAGAWESTSREHFSARQDRGTASASAAAAAAAAGGSGGGETCAGGGPGTAAGPWVFSVPGQALAVAKVTASVNGCLPRCLSPPPPARQGAEDSDDTDHDNRT